ncbi:vesicle-trafficking protein SEC22a isoform X2 [Lingula anatina]|uniref:Vesicle-trafficking protein SEC22a isoform X2 n=1 Tax=Lingula anatina TaxID=7574 RepID=A0A1S3HWK1_LINAN|nr:vesicle-trafficking protein SEC22a isoform X2 [Lingula anatina]|eukprot:XP_013389439.1 vesicle-trafficking protein SEC22a isoform X2 [Lingula anatina]
MVLFASIFRASDGLPLVALTDFDGQRSNVKHAQRYVKLISKKLHQLPDRCTLQSDDYVIHFITIPPQNISVVTVLDVSYPSVLGFCFLEEVEKEFIKQYDSRQVSAAVRPYTFMEFGSTLQRQKQRYGSPRSLNTRVNVADMSQQLKMMPPFQIAAEDVEPTYGGVLHKNDYGPTVTPVAQLRLPLGWLGKLSAMLNVICAVLNLTRGMSVINDGHIHVDLTEINSFVYGAAFMLTSLFCIYQIFLLYTHSRWKKSKTYVTSILMCLCQLVTWELRNLLQIGFHFLANLLITFIILYRLGLNKVPDYHV